MHNNTAAAMILNHYGIENQKQKLIEECAELIRAAVRADDENFAEETADVLLLIEQFLTVPGLSGRIEDIKTAKTARTLERMKNDIRLN